MRNELIDTLISVKEIDVIKNILMNMNGADISNLFSLLDYTDEETQKRWLSTYSELLKY